MNKLDETYLAFVRMRREIAYLRSSQALLDWDMTTMMPRQGALGRGTATAAIAGVVHERSVAPAYQDALRLLKEADDLGFFRYPESKNIRHAYAELERDLKVPAELVRVLADACSVGYHDWTKAKEEKDFTIFRPSLERIVRLSREKGNLLDPACPYDGLIAEFEPGATSAWLESVLTPLRVFLTGFLGKVLASPHAPDPKLARFAATKEWQLAFCRRLAEDLGYGPAHGRLDESEHPFSDRIHPGDLRITTKVYGDHLLDAVYSTVHEVGHAFYEGGLPQDGFGLATGRYASFGLHEANSRLWEIMIGHGRPFISFLASLLGSHGIKTDAETLYRAKNAIKPGLRRLEADEVTYNLHICLRFELEREIFAGRLEVGDLPEAWNAKTLGSLGLKVTDDAVGCLQDGHWADGTFGYFPTYGLANLYDAQLYEGMSRDVAYLERGVSSGDFAPVRAWLSDKVWRHGATRDTLDIVERATGEKVSSLPFIQYIEKKYGEIYRL